MSMGYVYSIFSADSILKAVAEGNVPTQPKVVVNKAKFQVIVMMKEEGSLLS